MPLSQSSAATADPSEAQLETLHSAGSSRETLRESEMDWKGTENKNNCQAQGQVNDTIRWWTTLWQPVFFQDNTQQK